MSSQVPALESVRSYAVSLDEKYSELLNILVIESDDIEKEAVFDLNIHTKLESETVSAIINLTKVIGTYLEKLQADDELLLLFSEIDKKKKLALEQTEKNIKNLNNKMAELKHKIGSLKLPKTAHKVYYSGNNPSLMDIKI